LADLCIIIFCGRSPRHLYVANRLCRAANVLAIVQETGSHWSAKKIRRMLAPANLWRKASRWLRDRKRYQGNPEAKFFFGDKVPTLERPDLVVEVPHINHPRVLQLVERHCPDLVCVFGTSLIRGALLAPSRPPLVNLHGGLSPEYRGADCTFWALYNGEPEKVGCTLHFINQGIDTGDLIAHIMPEVHKGDEELVLFWRGVQESAEAYVEFLRRFTTGQRFGRVQGIKGNLYQVKDRTASRERELSLRTAGGYPDIELPRRINWFGFESA
jgi:methionyl-tRNA formyltransferase